MYKLYREKLYKEIKHYLAGALYWTSGSNFDLSSPADEMVNNVGPDQTAPIL